MPRRLLLALFVLVVAPLVLLGWVSTTAMRTQQETARQQLTSLLQRRLVEIDRDTSAVFQDYQRRITRWLNQSSSTIALLRELQLSDPVVRQSILVSDDGLLLYPTKPTADDPEMIALHAALLGMIGGRPDVFGINRARSDQQDTRQANGILPQARWQVWYMDEGAQLLLWFARSDGTNVGVLLERARWMSDLTAALPDSSATLNKSQTSSESTTGFTALIDESQQTIYRWGDNGDRSETPLASLTLSPPLATWQLQFHSNQSLIPESGSLPIIVSLAGIGVLLIALGAYVLTSVQRQMRAARNRVSFAGQVSHELRTPLTNIRLYAELAEADLEKVSQPEIRESIQRRLDVIDTESRRLGRLVSGVLEMIRDDVRQRAPRLSQVNPDELLTQTLQQFAPSFENADIQVHRVANADATVNMDADIFDMVLINLLSNVEKYAADGKRVDIESRFDDDYLVVRVTDAGGGIAPRHRRTIFRPFSRLDDSINAPSGTGIGLTIALRAAQRHGGDLCLVPTQTGACFELRIPIGR